MANRMISIFVVASGNEETENELDEIDKGIILIDDENEEE